MRRYLVSSLALILLLVLMYLIIEEGTDHHAYEGDERATPEEPAKHVPTLKGLVVPKSEIRQPFRQEQGVSGLVVNEAGLPIAGASAILIDVIQADADADWAIIGEPLALAEVRTDEKGKFEFSRLPIGSRWHLECRMNGHQPTHREVSQGDYLRIVMGPALKIRVSVEASPGEPIADTLVVAWPTGALVPVTGVTDSTGETSLAGLGRGASGIVGAPLISSRRMRFRMPNTGTRHLVLQVGTLQEFSVQVVDSVGLPARQARVRVDSPLRGRDAWSQCDSKGRLTLKYAASTVSVRARSPSSGLASAVLRAGRSTVIRLAQGRTIRGRVVRHDLAVPGAVVKVNFRSPTMSSLEWTCTATRADELGTFHLTGVPFGAPANLTLSSGAAAGYLHVPAGDEDANVGDIVLESSPGILVVVGDTDSEPVGGATVEIDLIQASDQGSLLVSPPPARLTDAVGEVHFGGLLPGTWSVRVTIEGLLLSSSCEVGHDGVTDVLLQAPERQTMTVVVATARGAPLVDAAIILVGARGQSARGVTDSDGAVTMQVPSDVRSVEIPLQRVGGQWYSQREPVRRASSELRIEAKPHAVVLPVGPSGEPVRKVRVTVLRNDGTYDLRTGGGPRVAVDSSTSKYWIAVEGEIVRNGVVRRVAGYKKPSDTRLQVLRVHCWEVMQPRDLEVHTVAPEDTQVWLWAKDALVPRRRSAMPELREEFDASGMVFVEAAPDVPIALIPMGGLGGPALGEIRVIRGTAGRVDISSR